MLSRYVDSETIYLLSQGAIFYIILVASIAVHEWGHAYAADKLGDPLPRSQGRVTLNPLAHMDPIGTGLIPLLMIFLPIFMGTVGFMMIGWGRPVQVSLPNPKTEVRDDLIITAAGPLTNLLIALAAAILGGLLLPYFPGSAQLFGSIIYLNCVLLVFNLLPIPPLDGSHFLRRLIKMSDEAYYTLSSYGFIILIVLINIPLFRQLLVVPIQVIFGAMILLLSAISGIHPSSIYN